MGWTPCAPSPRAERSPARSLERTGGRPPKPLRRPPVRSFSLEIAPMSRSDCSFVRAKNGVRFAYVEQGDREGPAVLLLHGYTDSHRSFDLLRPHLPESWRVIALTQCGHGKTDKPAEGYTIGDLA